MLLNNSGKLISKNDGAVSSGEDKKTAWERLLKENKLGSLALIRNLRNMSAVDVDKDTEDMSDFDLIQTENTSDDVESFVQKKGGIVVFD